MSGTGDGDQYIYDANGNMTERRLVGAEISFEGRTLTTEYVYDGDAPERHRGASRGMLGFRRTWPGNQVTAVVGDDLRKVSHGHTTSAGTLNCRWEKNAVCSQAPVHGAPARRGHIARTYLPPLTPQHEPVRQRLAWYNRDQRLRARVLISVWMKNKKRFKKWCGWHKNKAILHRREQSKGEHV